MSCSRWNELAFTRFCQNELKPDELAAFHSHINACVDCRERFMLSWDTLLSDYYSKDDEQADEQLLRSSRWQQRQSEMASQQAERVRAQLKLKEGALRARRLSFLPFPARSLMKAAALLIAVMLPLASLYLFTQKSHHQTDTETGGAVAETIEAATPARNDLDPELAALAANYERASAKIAANAQDLDAIFARAQAAEKLFLYDQAQQDYRRYLELAPNGNRGDDAKERLGRVSDLIEHPAAPVPSRYDQLNSHIDAYLDSRLRDDQEGAKKAIDQAEAVANEMLVKTGERFGHDLISFYLPRDKAEIKELKEARQLRGSTPFAVAGVQITEPLERLQQAKSVFEKHQTLCEIGQTKFEMARYLAVSGNHAQALKLLASDQSDIVAHHYRFLEAEYLCRVGESYARTGNYNESVDYLNQSIKKARNLDVPGFLLRPYSQLAAIYCLSNKDAKTFVAIIENLKRAPNIYKNSGSLVLYQLLGMSTFNLNYHYLAESYLNSSINIARKLSDKDIYGAYIAYSHTYLAMINAELGKTAESEKHLQLAKFETDQITDTNTRKMADFSLLGYTARAQSLSGKYNEAIENYHKAIELVGEREQYRTLYLSQLHQGLGECYIANGQYDLAEAELTTASEFEKEARANFESSNALLTFAMTRKNSSEQLERLKSQIRN